MAPSPLPTTGSRPDERDTDHGTAQIQAGGPQAADQPSQSYPSGPRPTRLGSTSLASQRNLFPPAAVGSSSSQIPDDNRYSQEQDMSSGGTGEIVQGYGISHHEQHQEQHQGGLRSDAIVQSSEFRPQNQGFGLAIDRVGNRGEDPFPQLNTTIAMASYLLIPPPGPAVGYVINNGFQNRFRQLFRHSLPDNIYVSCTLVSFDVPFGVLFFHAGVAYLAMGMNLTIRRVVTPGTPSEIFAILKNKGINEALMPGTLESIELTAENQVEIFFNGRLRQAVRVEDMHKYATFEHGVWIDRPCPCESCVARRMPAIQQR